MSSTLSPRNTISKVWIVIFKNDNENIMIDTTSKTGNIAIAISAVVIVSIVVVLL